MAEHLRVSQRGRAAEIVIDRAARANAFTQAMWDQLPDAVAEACATDGARAVVVCSGSPTVFSAGADLEEYRANAGDVDWGLASQARVSRALDSLRSCPLPTIAAIGGACVGGGAGIALACDFRVASSDASFAIPPARLGLVFPFADTTHLVDLVGPAAAKRILLTAELVDAEWGRRVGLFDEVVPADELGAVVAGWVGKLAAVSSHSVRAMKRSVALAVAGQREETTETEALVREALASADHKEGTAAFLEGRSPRFEG